VPAAIRQAEAQRRRDHPFERCAHPARGRGRDERDQRTANDPVDDSGEASMIAGLAVPPGRPDQPSLGTGFAPGGILSTQQSKTSPCRYCRFMVRASLIR
jgi:hypothetical protein